MVDSTQNSTSFLKSFNSPGVSCLRPQFFESYLVCGAFLPTTQNWLSEKKAPAIEELFSDPTKIGHPQKKHQRLKSFSGALKIEPSQKKASLAEEFFGVVKKSPSPKKALAAEELFSEPSKNHHHQKSSEVGGSFLPKVRNGHFEKVSGLSKEFFIKSAELLALSGLGKLGIQLGLA